MEWWEDLYNRQIYFDLYEEDDTHLAEQQVQQVLALLHPADGASILDLCCGYGRHSIQLAQRGFRVTGIDISEKQIQHAREVAQQAHVPVDFRVADARKLNFQEAFDVGYSRTNQFMNHCFLLCQVSSNILPTLIRFSNIIGWRSDNKRTVLSGIVVKNVWDSP